MGIIATNDISFFDFCDACERPKIHIIYACVPIQLTVYSAVQSTDINYRINMFVGTTSQRKQLGDVFSVFQIFSALLGSLRLISVSSVSVLIEAPRDIKN